MTTKSDHLWQRLWRRVETTSFHARSAGSAAVPLSHLRDVPCLVLLGSPGLGKSNEIQLAAREAISRGEAADVIPLGRLSGIQELKSRILTKVKNVPIEGKIWNIFLDGLDEALPQFTKNDSAISIVFRSLALVRDLSTVRLRISCRSAEWPKALEEDLNDFWGSASVQVYELQELGEADVVIAASQFSPERATKFLEQIRKSEVEALTERPVTLNMLLDVFERDSQLPSQRVQLYREALLASVGDRSNLRAGPRLDPQAKLMIAARIAVASILSNSSEIWTGIKEEMRPGRTIVLSDIAGGFEPTSEGSIPVGEAELSQVLLTSLFSLVSNLLFVWVHQSFAEFLAAYYLIERGLSPSKIFELIRTPETSRIAPQLREVSAWLASMDSSFFGALVDEEPDILLRSDIASASPQDRQALVGELLLRYERSELHDFDFNNRSRYDQLCHPTLGEQLRPFIEDRTKNIVVRRVAIDIAEANDGAGLADFLAALALDPSEIYHVRTQAAAAISKIQNEGARLRLRPLIGVNALDEDDELKGYALRSLWPKHLSVVELIGSLTPEKNSSLIGAYAFFLSSFEVPELREDDVLVALDWILSVLGGEESNRVFDRVIPRFLNKVWDRADSPVVIRNVANFVLKLVSSAQYFSLQESAQDFFDGIGRSTERRIALVREIVRNTAENNWSWLAFAYPTPLISDSDLPWLLE